MPLNRIVSPTQDSQADFRLDNHDHLEQLIATINTYDPALVVLDSFSRSHGRKENETGVQELLAELNRIAVTSGVPVLVLHHTRKGPAGGGGMKGMDDVRGSSAIIAVPRSVIGVYSPDPDDDYRKVIEQWKNNIEVIQNPIGMEWVSKGDRMLLEFGEAPHIDAKPSTKKVSAQDRAGKDLEKLLADGAVPVQDIRDHMEDLGYNWETVKKASVKIGVTKHPEGPKGSRWELQG